MKKIISFIIISIIVFSVTLLSCGCNKHEYTLENSWEVPDYTSGEVKDGLSALSVFNKALENYNNAEYITYIRSMDFEAGIFANQQTIDITKFYENEIFYQGTKQGEKLGKSNVGQRFYYDGVDAYEIYEDSEERFPSLGTEKWDDLEYKKYNAEELSVEDKLKDLRNFTLYTINEDTLSDNHDDKVYNYDDKLYICLTFDCMNIETDGIQKAVEEAIMKGLGSSAKPGTFEWKSDTKLYLEITEIDNEYYITARNLQENYQAVQAIAPVECNQITSGRISYSESDSQIIDSEKLNLS